MTVVTTSVNTNVTAAGVTLVFVSTLISRRYYELVDQMIANGDAQSVNHLFAVLLGNNPKPNNHVQNKARGSAPSLKTVETVATKLGLQLNYFTDRPDYDGPLDYRPYLRRGSPFNKEPLPPTLASFFNTPLGKRCDETTRDHLLEYDRRFGPIPDEAAAQVVMNAYASLQKRPAPEPPKPKRKPGSGEYAAVKLPAAVGLHEPRAKYGRS